MIRRWKLALTTCCAALMAAVFAYSCGGATAKDGTDSHTHWLSECQSDAECGSLRCLCGICSRPCSAASECSDLAGRASCEALSGCRAAEPAVVACELGCSGDTDCQQGSTSGRCSGGRCRWPVETSQASPVQSDSASGRGPCDAMDAGSVNGCQGQVSGYAWNGVMCTPLFCGCSGADCGAIYATGSACDRAHAQCYEQHGVSLACTRHSDCALADRTCCGACNSSFPWVMAQSSWPIRLIDAGICIPVASCSGCEVQALFSAGLDALCLEGMCTAIDLGESAYCDTDADCHVRTKDCCECGGDTALNGVMAVGKSYPSRPDWCPRDQACDACMPTYPQETFCETTLHRCSFTMGGF
jgi:hypothetical protein